MPDDEFTASKYIVKTSSLGSLAPHMQSEWTCYLFGSKPGARSFVWIPEEGSVPNFFVRWMMRVCLGCSWVKDKKIEATTTPKEPQL